MIARRILGTLAGVVLANMVIFGWEQLLLQLPFGQAIDMDRLAEPGTFTAIPVTAKLWVVAGWFLGAFLGALLAFRTTRWDFAGWIVGALVAAAGLANVLMLPHPLWMSLCAVVLPFFAALFAFGLSRRWRATDLHLGR